MNFLKTHGTIVNEYENDLFKDVGFLESISTEL